MPSHVVPAPSPTTTDDTSLLQDDPTLTRAILTRFILLFSLFMIILAALIHATYKEYTKSLESKLIAQEEAFVASSSNLLQKEMHVQLLIVNMTSKSKALSDYLATGSEQNRRGLINLFQNLIMTFQDYDQARLIDLDGNEILRVEQTEQGHSVVVNQRLQNKSKRYYFQQALKLKPQEIYVSPMDLNVENGQVETPYQPTIRFITPVVNSNNQTTGLLVLNYSALELLENFRHQITLRLSGQGMLIDPEGYWLSNHDRSNEWGKDLGHLENHFKQRYPNAWPVIAKNDGGILKTEKGLFRYQAVHPLDFNQIESPRKSEKDHQFSVAQESISNSNWKMVIFLPTETIEDQSFFYKPGGRVLMAVLIIAIGAIMLLLVTLSEQRKSRYKRNKQLSAELKDLYENAPCGYHSLNADGIITRINNTELNWLGYSREEVIGHSYKKFLTPASQAKFDEFLSTLLNNQNIEGTVLEIQTKSGKTFFASTSAVVLLNEGNFALARASTFDISDRIKLEKRLEFLAHTDVLTGVSNRRHFFEQVEPLFASKVQQPMSLLMMDIDYFKKINDNYGHDAGDEVLKKIAKIIKKQLHHSDIFARFGGEEFIVFTKQPIEQAAELAERINQCVSGSPIKVTSTLTLPATLSIGVASCKTAECDIDDVLKQADIALYKAKENGRDRVEMVR